MEYAPYEQFINIKFITEGNFSKRNKGIKNNILMAKKFYN
jgi:hypothetical protein